MVPRGTSHSLVFGSIRIRDPNGASDVVAIEPEPEAVRLRQARRRHAAAAGATAAAIARRRQQQRQQQIETARTDYIAAQKVDTIERWQAYLSSFPDGTNAPAAKARLVTLQKQDAEQKRLVALKAEDDRQRAVADAKRKEEEELARARKIVRDLNMNGVDTVFFSTDSFDLSTEAQQVLLNLARRLQQDTRTPITIEAYADEPGTPEYNTGLAARRLSAVRDFLVRNGLERHRILGNAWGNNPRLISTCHDIACSSQNRRARVVHNMR